MARNYTSNAPIGVLVMNRVVTKMMRWFSETGCEVRGYRKKERGEVEGRNRRVELPIRLLTDSPFFLYLSRLG